MSTMSGHSMCEQSYVSTNTEKHENYHRKVRDLPRKRNFEEVEPPKQPKKYEFYCENLVEENYHEK